MRHRWYSVTEQRFISRDPIGLAGGPNLYKYTYNPVTRIDPIGLDDDWKYTAPNERPVPSKDLKRFAKFMPKHDGAKLYPDADGKLGSGRYDPLASKPIRPWPGRPPLITQAWNDAFNEFLDLSKLDSNAAERGGMRVPKLGGLRPGGLFKLPDFGTNLILLGFLFSLNRVAKADPCDKGTVAASEGAGHLGQFLIGAGIASTRLGQVALQTPVGRGVAVGMISYGSTRQFMTETTTGQVAEQFWQDTFADGWASYYSW